MAYRLTENQYTPLRKINELYAKSAMGANDDLCIEIESLLSDHIEGAINRGDYKKIGFCDSIYISD